MNRRRLIRTVLLGGAGLLATGCAPTVQSAMALPPEFRGARFDGERFNSFDGAPLGLFSWLPPDNAEPWAVIVGLHGMNDYAQTYYLAGPYWAERGIATYAYDARGHGRSPRRGEWGGETLMTEDLRTACAVARSKHPGAILAVVGESMGAATAVAAFGSAIPPDADRLVLVSPAVWGWSELPDLYALTLWLGAHTMPGNNVTAPRNVLASITPSDNNEMLRARGRDALNIFETRIDAVYGLVTLMERAFDLIGNITAPTAFLYGAHDQIIPRPSAERAARLLPGGSRTALYQNGYHMLLRDLQRQVVLDDILSFIRDPRAAFPSGAPPFVQLQANR